MSYEENKQQAAAQVDKWFIADRKHFIDWAQRIADRCEAWVQEASRLNPPPTCTYDEKDDIYPPFEHPILFLMGRGDNKTGRVTVPVSKLPPDDALMVYYAALITLHDLRDCYPSITQGIWPDELWSYARYKFVVISEARPELSDKSEFIRAALSHVQDDLLRKPPQSGAGKPRAKPGRKGLTPKEKRQYQRWTKEWDTGNYPTYADCAKSFGGTVQAGDIKKAKNWCQKNPKKPKTPGKSSS